jgi:hypothetical protein
MAAAPELPLAFVPRQSTLTLSDKATTVLKHEVQHGTKPYRFTLTVPLAGMTLDAQTGDLTLDNKQVLALAASRLEKQLNIGGDGAQLPGLQFLMSYMYPHAARMLGRQPRGMPVTIPIVLTVEDALKQASKFQYFVLAEVPVEGYIDRLKKDDEAEEQARLAELEKKKAAATAAQAGQAPAGVQRDLPAQNKKLDSLEEHLDQTTR